MTPEQALDILAQMVVRTHATLADHQIAQQALATLKGAITASTNTEPEEGN